jgi:hypothetical protein
MATATNLAAQGGRNAFDTIAASTPSSELVAAAAGKRIRVHSVGISCGGTPSTVQFLSAAAACSPVFQNSISLPYDKDGIFQTASGAALNVATGSGSTSAVIVKWSYAKA